MPRLAVIVLALALATLGAACRGTPPAEADPDVSAEGDAPLPQVADWTVSIEGNRSFSQRAVRKWIVDELADFDRTGCAKWPIDDAAFTIETQYRERGFPFARVEYDYDGPADGHAAPVIRIHEGRRATLSEVRFAGHTAFRASRLRTLFGGPRAGLLETGPTYYVESAVESGASELAAFYREQGFLDVRVSPPEVTFDQRREKATVLVRIEEGRRHRLSEILLEGELLVPEDQLMERVQAFVGRPYFARLSYEIRARLRDSLADQGYPDAQVEVAPELVTDDLESPEVPVRLHCTVTPGPQVRLRRILIEGNDQTREGFVRARLEMEEGEFWTRSAEELAFRRLLRSGLFNSVRMDLVGEGTERDLVVRLEEAPSAEVWAEPGYGSYEKLRMRAGYREGNLFGGGRIFEGEVVYGGLYQSGEVSFIDPWFLATEVTARVSVFASEREEPSFTSTEVGGGLTFSKDWTQHFATTAGWQLTRSDARDIDIVTADVRALEEELDISALTFNPSWDYRDDIFLPSEGFYVKPGLEWSVESIGSEIDFLRLRYSHAHYFAFQEKRRILAMSVRTGIIWVQDAVLPLQERFFNGGENTVRSFKEDELGPKDVNGEPLGGETYSVLTVELRQRLTGSFAGALFVDAGNVAEDSEDYLEFDGFSTGIGAGIRYLLPIGPLRLDAAVNPNPEDDEDDWAIHFSVGMSF